MGRRYGKCHSQELPRVGRLASCSLRMSFCISVYETEDWASLHEKGIPLSMPYVPYTALADQYHPVHEMRFTRVAQFCRYFLNGGRTSTYGQCQYLKC